MAAIILFYVFINSIGIVISKINNDKTTVFMLTLTLKPFSVCLFLRCCSGLVQVA